MLESPDASSTASPRVRPAPLKTAEWLLLLVLAAIQFTHILDFMILMPLGPRYLSEMQISTTAFGFLVAAYAFSASLSGLLAAIIIDRFDRKQALLTLYCGFTLGTFLCAVAPNYPVLLLGRCVAGMFGGIAGAVTLAAVGDLFKEERRGLATGVIMSSFSIATIFGLPIGLSLAKWFGTSAPFYVLGGVDLFILICAFLVLPPIRSHLAAQTAVKNRQHSLGLSKWQVLVQPVHLRAYALMTSLVFGMFMIVPFMATYLVLNVRWSEDNLPLMYFCGGIGTISTMSLIGAMADRFGKLPVFRIFATLTAIPILVVTNLTPAWAGWTLVFTTMFMICASGRMVPAMAMITSSAAPAYRGSFMSVTASVQQLASGLASVVAGLIVFQPGNSSGLVGGHAEGGVANLALDSRETLVGYSIVGILAAITTLVSVYLAGYVRPYVERVAATTPQTVADIALAPTTTHEAIQVPAVGVKVEPVAVTEG